MPQPGSILGQITEEFEQIGKQVVTEVAKVPKDVAGKALESLGASSGKKSGTTATQNTQTGTTGEKTPLQQLNDAKEQQTKKAIARSALEQIAGVKPKQKEPSVWEKIQMEAEQKKELASKQAKQAQAQSLPQATSKRKRGDLYGTQAKKTSVENKNVRQD